MGPLTTYGLVDQGWSLIITLGIGFAFGMILEQSGFSSSRKLAGVFYGYDFVVLKVFFTAGITAMAGLVFMSYFGLIDLKAVFINSNFLISAVTGGVIMGFGFILGGFCPGTSVTGAMIGKIDAMVFIVGIFLGIFVFGAFYDTWKPLFSGYYFDGELISDTLGLPKHLFVAMMIFMALAAFGVGAWFEKNAKTGLKPTNQSYSGYFPEIALVVLLTTLILFMPQESAKNKTRLSEKQIIEKIASGKHLMTADRFAHLLINDMKSIKIIDVRDADAFNNFHFPGSVNIPLNDMAVTQYSEILQEDEKNTVLVSNGGIEAAKAIVLCYRMGLTHISMLEGGINGLVETLFYRQHAPEGTIDYSEKNMYRFREKAAALFANDTLSTGLKLPVSAKPQPNIKLTKAAGGC